MGLNFKARVLLELGAELISSDAVAIYELVKNAVDAKSPKVTIFFGVALQYSAYKLLLNHLSHGKGKTFDATAFVVGVEQLMEADAEEEVREAFLEKLGAPRTRTEAATALEAAYFEGTFIRFEDQGSGMTLDTLQKGYLTIGTPMRLLQKGVSTEPNWSAPANQPSPTLGEKGIGRLAAMRLGHYVRLETTTAEANESYWRDLELDWRPIFSNPNLDADALDYEPERGRTKDKKSQHGTNITIRAIQADWTDAKLEQLARTDLVKLADPFRSDFIQDFLRLRMQGRKVLLPEFENSKLEHADAVCKARFRRIKSWNESDPLDGLELSIEIDYKTYKGARRTWHLTSEHLASCIQEPVGRRKKVKPGEFQPDSDTVVAALPSLGPFEMEFYWFNRGRLMRDDSDLWMQLQPFVKAWSGGLLVYRDGFRVHPYGSATDDWLDLDRSALAGSAYKLNRAQIIGCLRITQTGNPALLDQTNREGFRDCPEKEALRRLLRHILITKCKLFFEDTMKENKDKNNAPESMETLENRVGSSELAAVNELKKLQKRVPQEAQSIDEILFQIGEIRAAWERAKATIKTQDDELEQYVHLAGVGLQVEFIAHELSRVTGDALRSLRDGNLAHSAATRVGLEAQLKTLEKRIRVLDLLSIPGRQRKKPMNLAEIVNVLAEMHQMKATRHGVTISVRPPQPPSFKAKVEQGQILQILDNLFSNSFYWLDHRFDKSTPARISIVLDREERKISFTDNGPGVPADMAEDIFKPFVTTKPPGNGRGLGLFIARRLAEYNDATLDVLPAGKDKVHRGFVLNFKENK